MTSFTPVASFMGGMLIGGVVWGVLGDRKGFRLVFVLSLLLWIGAFGMMLVAHDEAGFVLVFVAMGAASSGALMGAETLVWTRIAGEPFAVRLEGDAQVAVGQDMPLGFPAGRLNLFDAASGIRL